MALSRASKRTVFSRSPLLPRTLGDLADRQGALSASLGPGSAGGAPASWPPVRFKAILGCMSQGPLLSIDSSLKPCPVRVALVWGSRMPACPASTAMPDFLQRMLDRVRFGEQLVSPERKAAVRDMLRHGAYKPTGRGKPASEYLVSAAQAGGFPLVNGPVDVNNAVSLQWGYPASIFDAARTGGELLLRRGASGESYRFNASGQTIELEDLLCVCRKVDGAWKPCGNPVKDSMDTKTSLSTTAVIAVLFAPSGEEARHLEEAAQVFRNLLSSHCGAQEAGFDIPIGAP
jgi:DNA/RNA-binding domain of Phe-tRNA-synthetase-like protein